MEEQFIVSARKYRPQKFDDVVGQGHISQTLKNSIKNNQLAHSFLFCGPRGVGKTTTARILAKTINCKNLTPEVEACDQCDSCVAFNQNASFNIHELDAASNNSVEDIRGLVEQVRYAPQNGKYKIYIIDEVHMLSSNAFNAFLKTLEEPPAYAKFILATTEKHKIIPTILSRCQIFDFKRITNDDITKHLQGICTKENIQAEEMGLQLIAQKADGGLRDALSMFDRLTSLKGNELRYADVLENLNVLDYDYYFQITDAIASENTAFVLNTLEEIMIKGFEPENFIQGLTEHFRNLLVCRDPSTVKLLHLSGAIENRYLQQAALISENLLINCLNLGSECDIQYKTAKNKRLLVEITLIKMCYINKLTVKSLIGENANQKKNNLGSEVVENTKVEQIAPQTKEIPKAAGASELVKIPTSLKDIQNRVNIKPVEKEIVQELVEVNLVSDQPSKTFNEAWNMVLEHFKNTSGVIEMLTEMKPEYESSTVQLSVVNNIHKRLIDAEIPTILKLLKTEMQSEDLRLETVLVEKADIDSVFKNVNLTPKEQLERMVTKSPGLQNLINQLGLELEY